MGNRRVGRIVRVLSRRIPFVYLEQTNQAFRFLMWRMNRCSNPPAWVKQKTIRRYAREYDLSTFIETGTYLGDTVWAVRDLFRQIYSIELDMELCCAARKRFVNYRHITILGGDSSIVLPRLMKSVSGHCLFWLDAHYSGGVTARGTTSTPIINELQIISMFDARCHVVLIDDADCFVGRDGYPTMAELRTIIEKNYPGSRFQVEDNIIRIYQ